MASDSVTVFLRAWDAPADHEQIALIDAYEVARCSVAGCPSPNDVIRALKERAGAVGANGIIIEGELAEIREIRRGETAIRVIAIHFDN